MLKSFGRVIIFSLLVMLSTTNVFAKQYTLNGSKVKLAPNTLYLNGEKFKGDEINPLNIDNRVYIAVQDLEKLVQSKVKWDKKKEIINVVKDNKHIQMKKGNSYYHLNGSKVPFDDGTKVQIVNSRSMIPLSFAIEEFNLDYSYDAKKKILYLNNSTSLFGEEDNVEQGLDEKKNEIKDELKEETIQEVFEELSATISPQKDFETPVPTKEENAASKEAEVKKEETSSNKEASKEPTPQAENEPKKETEDTVQPKQEAPLQDEVKSEPEKKEEVVIPPAKSEPTVEKSEPVKEEKPVPPPVVVKKVQITQQKKSNLEAINILLDDNYRYNVSKEANAVSVTLPYAELKYRTDELKQLSFIEDVQVNQDKDADKMLCTFTIRSGANMDFVKVEKNNRKIVIKYELPVVKTTVLSYKKDRAHSILRIPLQNGSSVGISKNGNLVQMIIPKTSAGLPSTRFNGTPSDRLIHYYEITSLDDNNYKVEVSLKDRVDYDVLSDGSNGSLVVQFNKSAHSQPKILIDPGHGGKDSGAVKNGLKEKELNMEVCSFLVPKLRELGYDVVTTRDDDSYPTLDERANLANQVDADLFISIHHNSASRTGVKGMEFYYYSSEDSKKFARLSEKHLLSATGASNRGVKNAKFVVIRKTHMPAVLLELGFMTNLSEAQQLADPNYQKTMSDALVNAINEYFGR